MAGWHSAAALNGVDSLEVVIDTIFPPQQKPTTPQVLMEGYWVCAALTSSGTFAADFGGAPVVWKKLPSAFPFSSLSGGYLLLLVSDFGLEGRGEVESVPRDIGRLALEEVWHKDLVLVVLVRGRQDVCALDRLREVAEDIIDEEDSFVGIGRARNIFNCS